MIIHAIQAVSMFFFIWYGQVTLLKGIRGHAISAKNFMVVAASITAFVMVTWMI